MISKLQFSRMLYNLRHTLHVTQAQFAKMIGISRVTLSKYEHEANPSGKVIDKIKNKFGDMISSLFNLNFWKVCV